MIRRPHSKFVSRSHRTESAHRHRVVVITKRIVKLAWWLFLVLLVEIAAGQQSRELRVSATIPPHPCQFPIRCDPVKPGTDTMVTVDDGVIRYIGSPPSVTRTDELITIIF